MYGMNGMLEVCDVHCAPFLLPYDTATPGILKKRPGKPFPPTATPSLFAGPTFGHNLTTQVPPSPLVL